MSPTALRRSVTTRPMALVGFETFFASDPGHYYAAFWLDPFGIKLEAVCHYDRD